MDISAIALGGLDRAYTQFQNAANQIAGAGAASAGPDAVDLSSAAVSMVAASDNFAANIATLKVADDMQKHTLDILA
jgi:flagellar basal body rod protein FlgC